MYCNSKVSCRALDDSTGCALDDRGCKRPGFDPELKTGKFFSHIGSNFVTKGGFSGAADTNQALSRHPFDHALDNPFLPETLLLVLSTEL